MPYSAILYYRERKIIVENYKYRFPNSTENYPSMKDIMNEVDRVEDLLNGAMDNLKNKPPDEQEKGNT